MLVEKDCNDDAAADGNNSGKMVISPYGVEQFLHLELSLRWKKREWKSFRNALDKSEQKSFDEMWDIPQLYMSACSNSVQLVPLHPLIISILFHHYKELLECLSEVEQMVDAKVNNGKKKGSTEEEEKLQEEYFGSLQRQSILSEF